MLLSVINCLLDEMESGEIVCVNLRSILYEEEELDSSTANYKCEIYCMSEVYMNI